MDQLRRRKLHFRFVRTQKSQAPEGEPADVNAFAASPDQIIGARQKLSAMYNAVDEMPLKVRQAFLLHRRSGMSYNDISSVEKYIFQALRHCRSRLAAHFPADDDPTEG